MDKKELKKQKDLYVAVKKKFITGLAELKSEGETEIAQQIAERLNAFVVGKMNPRSMVDRIRIQDGLPNSVFKQYFHDQLRQDLRNKVLYSAVKCRRKRSATPYHFTTTYMINNADGLREFLPALFEPVIGHGADYSIIIVDMDWAREFTIKYNWDEQEVILEFVVKRFHVASLDPNGGIYFLWYSIIHQLAHPIVGGQQLCELLQVNRQLTSLDLTDNSDIDYNTAQNIKQLVDSNKTKKRKIVSQLMALQILLLPHDKEIISGLPSNKGIISVLPKEIIQLIVYHIDYPDYVVSLDQVSKIYSYAIKRDHLATPSPVYDGHRNQRKNDFFRCVLGVQKQA